MDTLKGKYNRVMVELMAGSHLIEIVRDSHSKNGLIRIQDYFLAPGKVDRYLALSNPYMIRPMRSYLLCSRSAPDGFYQGVLRLVGKCGVLVPEDCVIKSGVSYL